MTTVLTQDARGRFTTGWRDDQLLDVVALVAQHADALFPVTVTMTAWDRCRGRALGLVDEQDFPPTARAITMRLNGRGRRRTWAQWLQVALTTHGASRTQTLVAQQRSEDLGTPSAQRVHYALNCVARELGLRTLAPDVYAAGREQLLARDRRRRLGQPGVLADMLPTSNQLMQGRDWPTVLALAELDPPERPRSRPAGAITIGSTSYVDAQVWFVRINGRYASRKTLRRWMGDSGAALGDWPAQRPYSECYDDAEALLRAAGIPVPAEHPRDHARGGRDYQLPPGGTIPGAPPSRAVRNAGQTDDDRSAAMRARCIQGLQQFAEWMADEHPGVRPTRRRYLAWRRGTDWPAPRSFDQFGGFSALLAEARQD